MAEPTITIDNYSKFRHTASHEILTPYDYFTFLIWQPEGVIFESRGHKDTKSVKD